MKEKFLDLFYQYIDEDDWQEGLDFYQMGKIKDVQEFDNLIFAKIESRNADIMEVRLKLHPSGSVIQWLECTCKKNRSKGKYCEHLAGFMIYLDSQNPAVFQSLNPHTPIKIPPVQRKVPKKEGDSTTEKESKATQAIISKLKANILNVSLAQNATVLRVKLAIKSGDVSFYDLGIDEACEFIQAHPELTKITKNSEHLSILDVESFFGFRIKIEEDEKVIVEKVLAVSFNPDDLDSSVSTAKTSEQAICFQYNTIEDKPVKKWFEFIPIKSLRKYLGKKYLHLRKKGYIKIPENASSEWNDFPLKKTYKEDEAAFLLENKFQNLLNLGAIWVDFPIEGEVNFATIDLKQIDVLEENNGWFFLDPRYGFDDSSISMIDFIKHYKKKKRNYLKHENKWLKIPEFIKQQNWELDESGQFLKLDTLGLIRLKATLGNFDHIAGSKQALQQITNRLDFTKSDETPNLDHTKLTLRHYQLNGLKWLWWLFNNNLHGLLADEMGLGKTHQAMALMSVIQNEVSEESNFLVISPTTVLDHWLDKMNEFCPNLKPFIYHGPQRAQDLANLNNKTHNVMVTSYGVLLRDVKQLTKIDWKAIILDEAHYIKNSTTETYKAACMLNGSVKICLTGTPIENNLLELKNIFDFLIPGFLGSNDFFKKNFLQPMEKKENGDVAENKLQKLIHPFKLRRIKANVLSDLPAKIEDIRHCHLSEDQIKLYKNILALKAKDVIDQLEQDKSPIPYLHVFSVLNHLKQICDHPCLFYDSTDYKKKVSGKFELLKEILDEALGSNHKIVIYSQYINMIEIIHKYLDDIGVGHVTLTGKTKNRGKVIDHFQKNEECRVFIGSLLAGGIGIDLTSASVVIHYDRWWNSSKEDQATDRVHRIGQQKNVQVLKLVTRGTLEEKIHEMIETKKALFEKFMDRDEEMFKSFTREELLNLLK